MIEIYEQRGIATADAETIVTTMAKYPKFFVDVMMRDELGMEPPDEDAKYDYIKSGAYCFTSFLVCGSVPLIGYVAFMPATSDPQTLFAISCVLTACALFMLGALKSQFTLYTWYRSGLEVLVVGGGCAAAAYLMGWGVEATLAALGMTGHHAPPAGNATI